MTGGLSATIRALRPGWWPCLWMHFLLGARLTGFPAKADADALPVLRIAIGGGLWGLCLFGAGAAVSAAFARAPDPDVSEGDEETAPLLPAGWVGMVLMLIGTALAPILSWWFLDVWLIGILIVVLYAVRPIRLARWAPLAALVEAAAVGGFTLWAPQMLVGPAHLLMDHRLLLTAFGFGFLILALRVWSWPEGGRAAWLYAVCLINAFVCLIIAGEAWGAGSGKWTMLAVLPLWIVMGWARYRPAGWRISPDRNGPGIWLCLLTDLLAISVFT